MLFSDHWLRVKPTPSWENEVKRTDTAIVLAFGYEVDQAGFIHPGKANEFLLEWTMQNTRARTVILQEGVWAAMEKLDSAKTKPGGWQFYRIHPHSEKVYVNTREAAYCALERMAELGRRKAILVAHDLQLERCAWDFQRLIGKHREWNDMRLIIPEIPSTPFVSHSVQWHTRNQFFFKTL